ncbi:MAG: trans-aconitate 2-methyltransferase, partial [Kofleriaceae bacterium]
DLGRGRYPGESIEHAGRAWVHRPFRSWVDLAERLGLRLLTPHIERELVRLRFEPLDRSNRWDASTTGELTERYGNASAYSRITKLEDPGFVLDFADALDRVDGGVPPRILDLGVNTGDELALIHALRPAWTSTAAFVGVDHSRSALEVARRRFRAPNHQFIEGDLNALEALALGTFDLVVSLNTFQSAGIDDRELLRRVVQHHLARDAAVILGLPNVRYVDGELDYGARMKNFSQPELGLLIKDVAFYRKYLQQHHRQVFVTGKHYVLITAIAAPGDRAPRPKSGRDPHVPRR